MSSPPANVTPLATDDQEIVIRPARGWVPFGLAELWRYRGLLFIFALRDIKLRYKQTVLGVTWVVIQPLFKMLVFTAFFGILLKAPSDGTPYPVFTFCALLPWQLFALALTQSGNSMVENQALITKVYFPRLVLPLSSITAGLLDFAIGMFVLLILMACYGIVPGVAIVALPLFVLMAIATALAVGVWFAALNAMYRDFRFTLGFIAEVWFFLTPIAYSASVIPEKWRVWYGLNPMVGVVEGFRWSLLGTGRAPGPMLAASVAAVVVLLVTGTLYFRRVERRIADMV